MKSASLRSSLACCALILLNVLPACAQFHGREQASAMLIHFIRENDFTAVSNSLAADTNLARARYVGRLPLQVAASKGNPAIVALLLKNGADINATGDTFETSNHQLTALDAAIWYGHSNVCLQLLQAGANPNLTSHFDGAALHFAFTYNRKEMVGWLLAHGADPFLEGGNPYRRSTPLEMAINSGAGEFVPVLLREARVKPDPTKSDAQLLKDGVLPPLKPQAARILAARGPAMLAAAASRAQFEAVEALLDAGVQVTERAGEEVPVLQSVSLAEAAASKAKEFPAERWTRIRELLEKNGANFDVFAATGWGDLGAVRRLVSANAGAVQAHDHEGATPLHWAVKTDRPPMTSFWLEAGAALAATNIAGQTPLHLAVAGGLVDQVRLLLAANAPTAARDTNGATPLDVATKLQHSEIIRLLLCREPAGARPERGVTQPIHKAAESSNLAALAGLVGDGAHLEARNELGLTPLAVAVRSGHLAAAAFLVDQGANVNARDPDGNTLLHQILQTHFYILDRPPTNWLARVTDDKRRQIFTHFLTVGEYEQGPDAVLQAASFLLASSIDVSATNRAGKTAVQLAADEKATMHAMIFDEERSELMKLLGDSGGNLSPADAEGNTPLHLTVNKIDLSPAGSLIEAGADVNATNHLGQTPLHKAVENIGGWGSDEESDDSCPFQSLIKHGANVNAQDNAGLTPLHVVARSDSMFKKQAAQALLKAGANPNLRDKQKRTPAHLLFAGEWPWHDADDCLASLVKHGANLSMTDAEGRTPVHYMAKLGHQSPLFFLRGLSNVLTSAKPNLMARDKQGDTALHLAARSGTMDVFDWLASHDAGLDATNHLGETPRLIAARNTDPFARFRHNSTVNISSAVREGKLDAVAALIKADQALLKTTDDYGQTPLRLAVVLRRTNIVEFLEQHGAQWDAPSAVIAGRAQQLCETLARDPSAIKDTARGENLLHLAIANDDVPLIQILISAGADLQAQNDLGLSPLGFARLHQKTAAVTEMLRGHGAAENIFDTVCNGDVLLTSALLSEDKSLGHARNRIGISVVEIAAGQTSVEVLGRLLDNGAKADFPNSRTGRTPLHSAASGDRAESAELLIQRGATVEAADNEGFMPLHLAAANDSCRTAVVLLRHKANPNMGSTGYKAPPPFGAPDSEGVFVNCTPLHLAALFGQTNVLALLLRSGAMINATNAHGRTALDFANRDGFSHMNMWLFSDFGPPGKQIVPNNPALGAALQDRQRAAATLLEQAGGKRSTNPRPGFGPPGY